MRSRQGMSFIEMLVSMAVLGVLATASFPMVEHADRRARELELRESLREVRRALDRHYAEREREAPRSAEAERYPSSLDELVAERFLRAVPRDPMTRAEDWVVVLAGDGRRVFDLRSRSEDLGSDGRPYRAW